MPNSRQCRKNKPPCKSGFHEYWLQRRDPRSACCRKAAHRKKGMTYKSMRGMKRMFSEKGSRPLNAWATCLKANGGRGLTRDELFDTCRRDLKIVSYRK